MGAAPTFQVKITTHNEIAWEGDATSVSSQNSTGPFDLLPGHANFVTLVNKNAPIVVRTKENKDQSFSYERAIVSVRDGVVTVYTDI